MVAAASGEIKPRFGVHFMLGEVFGADGEESAGADMEGDFLRSHRRAR